MANEDVGETAVRDINAPANVDMQVIMRLLKIMERQCA